MKKTLQKIHKNVLSRFVYTSDMKQFGEEEYWYIPDVSSNVKIRGDCEDFVLACRELCIQEGIDNSRIVVCRIERGSQRGEHHAVLEVEGYILDNRQSSVRTINQLNREYSWIAVSGYDLCDNWNTIEGVD